MPKPRQSFRINRRAPRRRTKWEFFTSDPANVNPAGVAAHNLLSAFTDADREGATIARVIGDVFFWPGDASNITEATVGVVPILEEQSNAGAFPEPATDGQVKWMFWKRVMLGTQATGELGTGDVFRLAIDIKVKRRVPGGRDTLQLLAENDDPTHTFLVAVGVRVLLQLA